MAIATGTAIAIAAGASAGAGIASAKMQSSAANKAAKTQQQSANQALGLQRDIYNQQYQLHSPYMALGNSAATTLGRLTGVTPGMRFAAPPQQMPPQMGMPMGPQPGGVARPRYPFMGGGGTLGELAMMR